jgi:hypothetical protein
VDSTAVQEVEAMDQGEVCADLHRQGGMVVDEVDDHRMDPQCKASRQWVEERRPQDTTTATFTTKGHRPVNSRRTEEHHRPAKGHHYRSDKLLKWTIAQARLQQTTD